SPAIPQERSSCSGRRNGHACPSSRWRRSPTCANPRSGSDATGRWRASWGGMPEDVPDRYAEASPRELLPLGVRQILVHGDADLSVPYAQSFAYVEAAAGEAELVTLEGAGHFEPIDPQARDFPATVTAIRSLLEPSPPAGAR